MEEQAGTEGLFIDLGEQRPEDIADLKEGTGAAARDIHAAISRWRASLGAGATTAELVPVVLLYRQRNPRVTDDSQ